MTQEQRNDLVRERLLALEPDERASRERIAVIAAALGHELGLHEGDLVELRIAAHLGYEASRGLAFTALNAARAYEKALYREPIPHSVAETVADMREQFGSDVATALMRLSTVVQPIGF